MLKTEKAKQNAQAEFIIYSKHADAMDVLKKNSKDKTKAASAAPGPGIFTEGRGNSPLCEYKGVVNGLICRFTMLAVVRLKRRKRKT